MNLEVNRGSLSLITREGSPKREKMCLTYRDPIPSAIISSLQGMKIATFVQSWSVTVRTALYPCDMGSLVMKSSAMVSNGSTSGFGRMGTNGALVGQLFTLWRWHLAHPLTYSRTSLRSPGHQYTHSTNWAVHLMPRCPYTGESWCAQMMVCLSCSPPVTTLRPCLYQVPFTRQRSWGFTHGLRVDKD